MTAGPASLADEFAARAGVAIDEFQLSTRVFAFETGPGDEVLLSETNSHLPLIVRRGDEIIVTCDVEGAQAAYVADSKRPLYTYIPGFNIHKVPAAVRRPISNLVKSFRSAPDVDVVGQYSKLPLTSFEMLALVIDSAQGCAGANGSGLFRWPDGKRAVFVALHDVDTGALLRKRGRDALFQLERKHDIRSTWFVPTARLRKDRNVLDFLLDAGHEVGWHGHSHDHRLPFKPYADERVQILKESYFGRPENYPTGMRTPRLLKSNYLYETLERECPALRYDTSILRGIAPYYLWLRRRQSRILEIPTTVPSDILVYNQLRGIPRAKRAERILAAQIARTKKLLQVGGLISIVTHPEKDLSERKDFLDTYDQYLSFIKAQPDVWFTTAGELYKYWSSFGSHANDPA